MYPLTVREKIGRIDSASFIDRLATGAALAVPEQTPDLRGYVELAMEGGFPTASFSGTSLSRRMWLESYLDDLLVHDVAAVEGTERVRRDSARMRNYLEAWALNSAGTADHRTIFEAAGIAKATAVAYEDLLTRLMIIDQLPAWNTNRLKRLVRRPKRYVVDAALIPAALRMNTDAVLLDGDVLGRVIDTFVVAQLRAEAVVSKPQQRLFHLRTDGGRQEIDLIVECGGQRVVAIEIKASAAPRAEDARHLRWLAQELGERFIAGVVLHTGPRIFSLGERIIAAPISTLWG